MATLYRRNKTWYLNYIVQGKRVQKSVGCSKRLAELALKEVELKLAKHELGYVKQKVRIDSFLDDYLTSLSVDQREHTARRYKEITLHFKRFISTIPHLVYLETLKATHIEKYKLCRMTLIQPVTVNYELQLLRAIFKRAIRQKSLRENPAVSVPYVKMDRKSMRFFSQDEIRLLLDNCGPWLYPIFTTLAYTGMRLGELRHLEWSDVDFKRKLIRIQVKQFWQPKNSQPRTIPMNESLYSALQSLPRNARWVFPNRNGGKLHRNRLREHVVRLCKCLGLPLANVHTFRHTFASHLVMSGVDLPTVQRLMGHADIETTMRYAHLTPEHIEGAVRRLKF